MVARAAAVTLAMAMAALPAQAGCRLALVLALDVSSSVDAREYDLQRLGLAAALDAPEIRAAVLHPGLGGVALSVFEWSGHHQQKLHLDWSYLQSDADIDDAIETLLSMQRSQNTFPTAIGQAIAHGARLLEQAPICDRQVIDISGDGVNNHGESPQAMYRALKLNRVTVNGLVVLNGDNAVLQYYRSQVVRGPGAFVITARGFDDYRRAMQQKLLRELSLGTIGEVPQPQRDAGRG